MKKFLFILILGIAISVNHSFSQTPGDYIPNQVMVMLKPGYTINELLINLNNDGYVGQFRLHQQLSNRYRIYLLEHDAILGDSKKLIYDINRMDEVAIAQLNHYIEDRATPNDANYA